MTFSQTAYFKSEQSLQPTSLLQNSSSCLTFIFWRERRCSLPRLFRSLKLPLPLKRPVLKFPSMEAKKRRRGRPATVRSEESLEAERLYRAAWYAHRKRVCLKKRIFSTWKFLKGMSLLNSDSDFAVHLHL